MNPKLKHFLLDVSAIANFAATAITAQPQLGISKAYPAIFLVLSLLSFAAKTFAIGDIDPTSTTPAAPASNSTTPPTS